MLHNLLYIVLLTVMTLFFPRISLIHPIKLSILGTSFVFNDLSVDFEYRLYEPAHDKTYNKTCVTSEDSDQPAHSHSLIGITADHVPSTVSR